MVALTLANLKMMARNRQAIFWALFFPLMLVVVFGLIDFNGVGVADVAVIDQSGGPRAELLRERLSEIEFLDLEIEDTSPSEARDKVEDGNLGYLIIIPELFDDPAGQAQVARPAPVTLVYSTRNPDRNQIVDASVRNLVSDIRSDGAPVIPSQLLTAEVIEVPEVDYFDNVLLGLLALGIMTNSIISIAVRISTFRNQSIAGAYELDIDYTSNDGAPVFAQVSFILKEEASTPAIGSPAPASVTYTATDKEDISHITSSSEPDLDLYELSIHEALQQNKPLVVVFATPAFCVSATCGPQVGELTKVKEKLGDRANYIHVEVFEDPHLIENTRPTGGLVAAVDEWGLPTEPWTFVIDSQGLVRSKFEQFTTAEQIEAELLKIL